jgi:hypothetical protein
MNRTVLKYLIVCVVVLLIGVLVVGSFAGRLNSTTRAKAAASLASWQEADATLDQVERHVDELVESDPALFAPRELNVAWTRRFAELEQTLQNSDSVAQDLRKLLQENQSEDQAKVLQLADQLNAVRLSALNEANTIEQSAQQLVDFKRQIGERLPKMEQDAAAVLAFDFARIQTLIDQAIVDWPEKTADLQQRLESLRGLRTSATQLWESTEEARARVAAKEFDPNDINLLLEAADRLQSASETLVNSPKTLGTLIDQLYWSWDKSLVDLELVEGSTVQFRETVQTTKLPAKVAEGKTAQPVTLPPIINSIPKQRYEQMKSNLGMVIEHKPAGKFDSEAVEMTQPPAYAYIASPSEQRNQYGYWNRTGGSSIWVFYGQYAFLRDMIGGRGFGSITPTMYEDYRSSRHAGRTYYGSTPQGSPLYGSTGTVTRTKYADSKYVRSNGYQGTRYAQSGGTYRGSAYDRSPSTSSSSRSPSFGSSRSYSSRSSGSRSFGFGGK